MFETLVIEILPLGLGFSGAHSSVSISLPANASEVAGAASGRALRSELRERRRQPCC